MSIIAPPSPRHRADSGTTDVIDGAVPAGRSSGREPVVLMYHGFSRVRRDDDPENLFVTEDSFRAQLAYLLDHGWTPLDLAGYLAIRRGGPRPRKSFLVTIDDGLESLAEIAAPVLKELGVPAVAFVPSDLMGDVARWLPQPADEPILRREIIAALAESGIVIGGHGADHREMRGLSADELVRQTAAVRDRLTQVTGYAPSAFAYPYGLFDDDARRAVADAGYDVAFSVFDDVGAYAISRVDVNATDTLASLRVKLVPGYRRLWRASRAVRPMRGLVRRLVTSRASKDLVT